MMRMITEEMIDGYREHLGQEEYAGETVKKYLRDIRAFMVWLETGGSNTPGQVGGALEAEAMETDSESDTADRIRPIGVDKGSTAGWKAHLTERGYAPATVNAMLSSLNSFLGHLGWEECKVRFLKIQRRTFRDQERELSRTEYGRLLRAAREGGKERLGLLLETVCATGIRVSEVRYVTVEVLSLLPPSHPSPRPYRQLSWPSPHPPAFPAMPQRS